MAETTVTQIANAEAPREYGYPNDSFDFPYDITEDDATTGLSYDFAADGGTPRPYAYVSNEATEDFQAIMPGNQGNYSVEYETVTSLKPQNDYVSVVPAVGSADLSEPRDTPYYAPGTRRYVASKGPVAGSPEDDYSGTVASIGREVPGYDGPVSGNGDGGYSAQLALSLQQAYAQAYSNEAAASALVASV